MYASSLKPGQTGYIDVDCLISAPAGKDATEGHSKAIPRLIKGTCFYENATVFNGKNLKVTNEKGKYLIELPPGKPWFIPVARMFTATMNVDVVLIDQKGKKHTTIPYGY